MIFGTVTIIGLIAKLFIWKGSDEIDAKKYAGWIFYGLLFVLLVVAVLFARSCYVNRQIDKTAEKVNEAKINADNAQDNLELIQNEYDRGRVSDKTLIEAEKKESEAIENFKTVTETHKDEFPSEWKKAKELWCQDERHKGDCE